MFVTFIVRGANTRLNGAPRLNVFTNAHIVAVRIKYLECFPRDTVIIELAGKWHKDDICIQIV